MKKLYMTAAVCAVMFIAGCAPEAEPAVQSIKTARHVTSAVPEITVEQVLNEYNSSRKPAEIQAETGDPNAPIAVAGCACQVGDNYILYPKVDCAAEDIINSAICDAVTQRAEKLGITVFADYRVEYNRHGIFSLRMFLYDMYGDNETCIDCIPLTFNSETGERYRISDFFDSDNQNWRGRIPDIITAQAEDFQMVLLGEILPISDDRPFYITDEAVVIMYDLYEIATFAAGEPEFEIPVGYIAECLDDASVLNAMLPEEAAADEDAAVSQEEGQEQQTDTDGQEIQQDEKAEDEMLNESETSPEQENEEIVQAEDVPDAIPEEDLLTVAEEIQ